jgi:hypothetical protein
MLVPCGRPPAITLANAALLEDVLDPEEYDVKAEEVDEEQHDAGEDDYMTMSFQALSLVWNVRKPDGCDEGLPYYWIFFFQSACDDIENVFACRLGKEWHLGVGECAGEEENEQYDGAHAIVRVNMRCDSTKWERTLRKKRCDKGASLSDEIVATFGGK